MKIAVLLPCFNEGAAIKQCVSQFRMALPDAAIYVYDNNSTDNSVEAALEAGAIVRSEKMQGKGNVVRRMFSDIDADVYILADADSTYDASCAPMMVKLLCDDVLDMVVGKRVSTEQDAYRTGHRFGNTVLNKILRYLFGNSFTDILSGYRVFSRRFVKTFPLLSLGFEVETEISIHALELKLPVAEIETPYFARPSGSQSKLNTYRDGFRILRTIASLFRIERPVAFFGAISAALLLLALGLATPLAITYFKTGLVPRLPTAVLATGISLIAALGLVCGIILDTVVRGRREVRRLAYLAYHPPH